MNSHDDPVRRCLVIGSTSMVGSAIVAELSQSWLVKTAGRRDADVYLDLADPSLEFDDGERFDVAVLVAADFGGEEPDDYVRAELVNAVGLLSACRIAEAVGVQHFVLLSSASAAYSDGDSYFGIYSLSKRHGEEAARLYCGRRGLDLTTLRPTSVYDAAGRARAHQPLLYAFADRARDGHDIVINGVDDPLRNYIFVSDLAKVIARVIEARVVGDFGCPGPQSTTISEMARAALDAFGRGGQVLFDATRPSVPALANIPNADLYDRLGYWPEVDLNTGLRLLAARADDDGPGLE